MFQLRCPDLRRLHRRGRRRRPAPRTGPPGPGRAGRAARLRPDQRGARPLRRPVRRRGRARRLLLGTGDRAGL